MILVYLFSSSDYGILYSLQSLQPGLVSRKGGRLGSRCCRGAELGIDRQSAALLILPGLSREYGNVIGATWRLYSRIPCYNMVAWLCMARECSVSSCQCRHDILPGFYLGSMCSRATIDAQLKSCARTFTDWAWIVRVQVSMNACVHLRAQQSLIESELSICLSLRSALYLPAVPLHKVL